MDNILSRVQIDLKASMKAKDAIRVSTLRMMISALNYARIDKQADLGSADIEKVLRTEAKKRREAIEAYRATRPELAEKETIELHVIEEYLPEQLSDDDIQKVIESVVAEIPADKGNMGRIMGAVMKQLAGKLVDGNRVRVLVEEKIG